MNFFRRWLKPAAQRESKTADTDRSSYRVSVMRKQKNEGYDPYDTGSFDAESVAPDRSSD